MLVPLVARSSPVAGRAGSVGCAVDWKKALLVALVVVLVLIGVPVLMDGMGDAAMCPDCGAGVAAAPSCLLAATLVGLGLLLALTSRSFRTRRDWLRDLLRAVVFERPPRLV